MAIRINGKDYNSTINQPENFEIGTYHMSDNPNLFEPQRANGFRFVVPDLDGINKIGSDSATYANASDLLTLSVISCDIPHFSQQAVEIRRGNSVMKFAGLPSFNSGSLVIQDWIGADTKSILMAWQNLSYNVKTQKVGLSGDYQKDCYLCEYTPDFQLVRTWILHKCWISGLQEDGFNVESGDAKRVTATIEYNWAEIDTSGILFDEEEDL